MVICYLSLSIGAQASSLTPDEDSALQGLMNELSQAQVDYVTCSAGVDDKDVRLCFVELGHSAERIFDAMVEFSTLAGLSGEMADKHDERSVDLAASISLQSGISSSKQKKADSTQTKTKTVLKIRSFSSQI
jgi:hypothetical protein